LKPENIACLFSVQPQPVRPDSDASAVTDPNSEPSASSAADVSQQSDSSAFHDSSNPAASEPGLGVKVGSLQQFVHSDGDCEDRGPSAFPVHQVGFWPWILSTRGCFQGESIFCEHNQCILIFSFCTSSTSASAIVKASISISSD